MHVKLKKKFGQNFLVDKNILRKISNLIPIEFKNIIEIGPGIGHLTDFILLNNLQNLILIEIDKDFIPVLEDKYNRFKNIKIINDDIMNINLGDYSSSELIISNLPYNISSQILVKINNLNIFKKMILMFQKEFAERLISNKLNNLNCLIGCFYEMKKEFNISRNCFKPVPKIESSVITFTKREESLIEFSDISLFSSFKSMIFINKRKKISTILKNNKIEFEPFENSGFRAESFSLKEFIFLFELLKPELINKFS